MVHMSSVDIRLRFLILAENHEVIRQILNQQEELAIPWQSCHMSIVQDEWSFWEQMDSFAPDLVLIDYACKGINCLSMFQMSKETFPNVPFVFLVNPMNESLIEETSLSEAEGYVRKDQLERLPLVVREILFEYREDNQIWPSRMMIAKSYHLRAMVNEAYRKMMDIRVALGQGMSSDRRISA